MCGWGGSWLNILETSREHIFHLTTFWLSHTLALAARVGVLLTKVVGTEADGVTNLFDKIKVFCRNSLLANTMWALACGAFYAFTVHWVAGEEYVVREEAKVYAPFAGWNYPVAQREDSTVLLIDDLAIQKAGQQWPAQYSYYARLLKAVGSYEPRAIFLDMYFSAQREDPTLPRFIEQLCKLGKTTKIYLGATKRGGESYLLRPELEALAGTCFEKVALHYSPDSVDRLAWTYPLEETSAAEGHGRTVRTAALAMYEDATGKKLHRDEYPLALTWGLTASHDGIGWGLKDGKYESESYCRDSHGLGEYAPRFVRNYLYHDGKKPVCVYHETLSVRELAAKTETDISHLTQRLANRTVFIGTAFTDSADVVLSPIHGRIPGVYLHAMAFDNLMTFGQAYPRNVDFDWPTDSVRLKVAGFILFSLFLVTIVPKLVRAKIDSSPRYTWVRHYFGTPVHPAPKVRGWKKFKRILRISGVSIFKIGMSVIVGCALLYGGQRLLDIGVLSVVGIVFFTVAGEWTEINEKLSHFIFEENEGQPKTGAPHQPCTESALQQSIQNLPALLKGTTHVSTSQSFGPQNVTGCPGCPCCRRSAL